MQTVMVTGGGGYIGTELVEILLEAGCRVIALDRFFFGQDLLSDLVGNPNLTLVRADIRDIKPEHFQGVDAVCDLAALSNDPCGDLNPELTRSINHVGRVKVAQTAKAAGVKRYVLASSCSVYGHGKTRNLDETSETNPITTYAKSNLAAENDILPMSDSSFSVSVLRQATVFGISRRMRFDLVINLMTFNAVNKGRIFVMGGGKQWRPIIHVRDTAAAFALVLNAPLDKVNGQIFNVGVTNVQILNLAYITRENVPFPVETAIVPDDPDQRDYNVSFDKIREYLGFEPKYLPADGVREIYQGLRNGRIGDDPRCYTVAWYKKILEAKEMVDTLSLDGRLLS